MKDEKTPSKIRIFGLSFLGIMSLWLLFAYDNLSHDLSNLQDPGSIGHFVGGLFVGVMIAAVFSSILVACVWLGDKLGGGAEEGPDTTRPSTFFLIIASMVWLTTFFFLGMCAFLGISELPWVLLGLCFVALVPKETVLNRPLVKKAREASVLKNRIVVTILKRTPLIPTILDFREVLAKFYTEHKRRNLLYYYFFPIVGLPSVAMSKRSRAELKVLMVPVYITITTIVATNALSYITVYRPHLGLADLFFMTNGWCLFLGIAALFITAPLTATTGELLARKQTNTLVVVLIFGTIGLTTGTLVFGSVTSVGNDRNQDLQSLGLSSTRILRPLFQEDLAATTQTFLAAQECESRESETAFDVPAVTVAYQDTLVGIMSLNETANFKVVQMGGESGGSPCELAVFFKLKPDYMDGLSDEHRGDDFVGTGAILLFVHTDDGFFRSWDDLSDELKGKGHFPESTDTFEADGRYLYDGVLVRTRAQFALMDEYVKRKTRVGMKFGPNGLFGLRGVPTDCPAGWIADLQIGDCMPGEN